MTVTLTIDGVTKEFDPGSLDIGLVANGRSTLSVHVKSWDGSYRPALSDDITVVQDGTTIFGGEIESVRESGVGGLPVTPILLEITATDYQGLPDRRVVTDSYVSSNLKTRLTSLVSDYLSTYGVTLHASQANGPTLEAVTYDHRSLTDVLNELSNLTGYVWTISASKVLRMQLPSSVSAPFNVTAGTNQVGDLTVEPSRHDYANVVTVRAGAPSVVEKTDTFTGNGATTTFTLTYPAVSFRGYVTNAGVYETLGTDATWSYNSSTNQITRTSAPASPNSIVIVYDAQFPIFVTAQDSGEVAAHKEWEVVIDAPDVFDYDAALALADAELALRIVTSQTIRYTTWTAGLVPGQQQTITTSQRNLSAVTCLITEVRITNDIGNGYLRHEVTAVSSGFVGSWRDTYAQWSGTSSTRSLASSAGFGVASTTAPVSTGPVGDVGVLRLVGQGAYVPSAGDTSAFVPSSMGAPIHSYYRIKPAANRTINGIYVNDVTNGSEASGQVLVVRNDSAYTITWSPTVVTNARKLKTPDGNDLVIGPEGTTVFVYDIEDTCWKIVAHSGEPTGTWTPAVTFGGGSTGLTYTSRTGSYTRKGNTVTCQFEIQMSAKGSSTGTMLIGGLPFTSASNSGVAIGYYANMAAAMELRAYAAASSTTIALTKAGSTQLTDTDATATTFIVGTVTYFV